MYIERLYLAGKMSALLELLKIDPKEDASRSLYSCFNGKLEIYHDAYAKQAHKREIKTILTDYNVVMIYGHQPSKYDQERYINIMASFFEDYREDVKKAQKRTPKIPEVVNSNLEDDGKEND